MLRLALIGGKQLFPVLHGYSAQLLTIYLLMAIFQQDESVLLIDLLRQVSFLLTQLGMLTLPGVFTREKVNLPARVTLANRLGLPAYLGNPSCLVRGS